MHPEPGVSPAPPHKANPDPLTAHRTRVNSRTPLEPIGYDSEGAPLYWWQVMDSE